MHGNFAAPSLVSRAVGRRNPYSMSRAHGIDLGLTCTTVSVIDHQSSSTGPSRWHSRKKVVDSQLEARSFGGGRGGGADPARDTVEVRRGRTVE